MREKFGVKSQQVTIAGVNCYILTPDNIPEQNRNRLLVHVHGGGYVFGANPTEVLPTIDRLVLELVRDFKKAGFLEDRGKHRSKCDSEQARANQDRLATVTARKQKEANSSRVVHHLPLGKSDL